MGDVLLPHEEEAILFLAKGPDRMPRAINDENQFAAAMVFIGLSARGLTESDVEGDEVVWRLTLDGSDLAAALSEERR